MLSRVRAEPGQSQKLAIKSHFPSKMAGTLLEPSPVGTQDEHQKEDGSGTEHGLDEGCGYPNGFLTTILNTFPSIYLVWARVGETPERCPWIKLWPINSYPHMGQISL